MTAFVTGASGGIGRAICITLAECGYNVACAYNTNGRSAQKLCEELVLKGVRCVAVQCDITSEVSVKMAYEKICAELGEVSLLVNNAGVSAIKLFTDMSEDEINRLISVDLTGAMIVSKVCLPSMIYNKKGNIINISSMWGEVGASCEVAYSAAKAGLIGFTKALAKEEALSGIRVNCITAGLIDTPMNAELSEAELQAVIDEIPLSRIGKPQDVADAVEFLASEKSSYITGAVIKVNGGMIV